MLPCFVGMVKRIYVKKVRKFLDCAVDISVDKKQLKVDMDRALQSIKDIYTDRAGHDRFVISCHSVVARWCSG